jgi:hypothetical protein
MKNQTLSERFMALSQAEKAAELAPFIKDEPWKSLPGKPLNAAQRKQWVRIKRKLQRGRPTIGKGAKIVPVSIERGLLKEVDAYAKAHQMKRSQMVVQRLCMVMQRAKAG